MPENYVVRYHGGHCQDKEIRAAITRAVESSPRLRSKRGLTESFVDDINEVDDVMEVWHDYAAKESEKDLTALIETECLRPEETRKFIQYAFRDGGIKTKRMFLT